ncbi:MAG: homogentisate 1,2-dioxygenase [Ilumatobacteraceae bacterium]|nr:homogentisate 1,2-dioxygenase [Ilumatobacteraceae bacterium]
MPHYRAEGDIPRKRHTVHRVTGDVVFEELIGADGFSGASSLLYHRCSPSAVVGIDAIDADPAAFQPNHPVRPLHLRTGMLDTDDSVDCVTGRRVLLGNADIELAHVRGSGRSALYRNVIGDELIYVQSGSATLETSFGSLAVGTGDYVLVPMSAVHRWAVTTPSIELLVISGSRHITIPSRYLSSEGQLLEGAPFSERDQRGPVFGPPAGNVEGEGVDVLVRTRHGMSRHVHATHPFDVIGWDGCLYPWALNIGDFEPVVGRIHQPPSVHQTFAGNGFVVCSFVPRLLDFDPSAVKVPYHHANVDTDEVLFYSAGDFVSRAGSGIGVGSISVHPAGFVHGPQPGSFERSIEADRTGETAVMIDVFSPLGITAQGLQVADPEYAWSWSRQP